MVTRYDKLSERFLSFVVLTATFIWVCELSTGLDYWPDLVLIRLRDIQILTPMNPGRVLTVSITSCSKLNGETKPKVTRYGRTFSPGHKMIQIINNYDKDVFDDDIGIITAIDTVEAEGLIQFDDREIDYDFNELDQLSPAYATTIHKSQGSEYIRVIPLSIQNYLILERNLIYTGVTRNAGDYRAKKLCRFP